MQIEILALRYPKLLRATNTRIGSILNDLLQYTMRRSPPSKVADRMFLTFAFDVRVHVCLMIT
ncbi:hypothetical protein AS149_39985 [Burkholderia cenocepacia]|nr:hypothetical protein AS149_39985 [Burkholderia cenocepacia]